MNDMSSMSRESKKQQLRRQMITPEKDYPPNRRKQEEEEMHASRQKKHRRHMVLAILALALVFAGAGCWFYYQQIFRYTSYETVRQVSLNQGSLVGYETFGSNVLKYTRDGASYIDDRGNNVWTESYEMKMPIVAVNGNFAVIADQCDSFITVQHTLPSHY